MQSVELGVGSQSSAPAPEPCLNSHNLSESRNLAETQLASWWKDGNFVQMGVSGEWISLSFQDVMSSRDLCFLTSAPTSLPLKLGRASLLQQPSVFLCHNPWWPPLLWLSPQPDCASPKDGDCVGIDSVPHGHLDGQMKAWHPSPFPTAPELLLGTALPHWIQSCKACSDTPPNLNLEHSDD